MTGALSYLVWTSARNRLIAQVRRIRTPRYAVALIIGSAYVWWFFLRPQPGSGAGLAILGATPEFIVTILITLLLMSPWIFGGNGTALAFSPAEMALLFPAPVSRRALVSYKLFRGNIGVMINSLVWVFILRRGGSDLPSALRAISIWAMFSTLYLHQLGAALVRLSWRQHGVAGLRRQRVPIVVAAGIVITIVISLIGARGELMAAERGAAQMKALAAVLGRAPATYALFPFRLIVAPTFAQNIGEWWRSILPAFGIVAFHLWWVLRTDTAFEEAAVEASVERERRLASLRSRGFAARAPKARRDAGRRRTPGLSPVGHPAVAVLWKNTICLMRGRNLAVVLLSTAFPSIMVGVITASGPVGVIGTAALVAASMLMLFGGMLRNDLRHDMLNLPLIKSLPISGRSIVLAEVGAAVLPIVAIQTVLIMIAYAAHGFSGMKALSPETGLGVLIVAPLVLLAVNTAALTLQNGFAVLFPAWLRLGIAGSGVEGLGQGVMTMITVLVALAIELILPGAAAAAVYMLLRSNVALATAATGVVGALILLAENYLIMGQLGRVFERSEPSQVLV